MTGPAAGHRRELTAAVAGGALAGASALVASAQTWVELTVLRAAPLPATSGELSGSEAVPLVPAMGLLLLAAALALLAVRRVGRVVVGVLVVLAGGVLVWSGADALLGGASPGTAGLEDPASPGVRTSESVLWPLLTVLAGLLALATGVLVVVRGRRWPGLGRRYERATPAGEPTGAAPTTGRPETDEDRAQAAWTALDRGEDPTDGPVATSP